MYDDGSDVFSGGDNDGSFMQALINPASILIVGAHPDPLTIGGGVLANLKAFGFKGAIHLVSRSRSEIAGIPCVGSIEQVPDQVDAAVLIVPQAALSENVRACVAKGVRAIIAFSSGFAEAGEAGRAEQRAIAELCFEHGVAFLGPNCMGLTNYMDGVPLTFEPVSPLPEGTGKRVAIIAQSGATAANIRFSMQAREIPVSYVVSTGNEAALTAEDLVEFVLDDGGSAVIALYVEQLRKPGKFIEMARRARSMGVPIVMLHSGSSEPARMAAQSHTGAVAGDYEVMKTVTRGEAVVFAETTEELFDVVDILVRYPVPSAGKAAISTNSGAVRGLALDYSQRIGLPLAPLSEETHAGLATLLPDYIHVDNPLDLGVTGFLDPGIFGASTAVLLNDPGVSSVLLSLAGGAPSQQLSKASAIVPVAVTASKPLLLNILGDDYDLDAEFMRQVRASRIPFFRSPERAMRAMAVLHRYADDLAGAERRSTSSPNAVDVTKSGTLSEADGKALLRQAGIAVPQGEVARSVDEAVAAAVRIGFPVVLKAHAPEIAHKSDIGGVVVDIRYEASLRSAWNQIERNVGTKAGGAKLDGMLVEKMAAPGLEMVVGGRRDPEWGPVVMVGMGGVWVEALGDVVLMRADVGREDVVAALGRLRGARLLGPFRGQSPRDIDAVANVVLAIGALMRGNPAITEIDVNPLIVHAAGEGATAVDALFVCGAR